MSVIATIDFISATNDSVTISCQGSYNESDFPDTEIDKNNNYKYRYTYDTPVYYKWTFSDGETGTNITKSHTFTSLSAGVTITVSATLTIKCTRYKERMKKDENGEWTGIWIDYGDDGTVSIGTDSDELTVYTHPGSFTGFSNISTGDIIQVGYDEKDSKGNLLKEGLSAKRVNEWCDHCNKYLSWKNQPGPISTLADACKVNSGDFITAAWYNQCAETCGISTRVSNDLTQSNSLITAECIKTLGTAISS